MSGLEFDLLHLIWSSEHCPLNSSLLREELEVIPEHLRVWPKTKTKKTISSVNQNSIGSIFTFMVSDFAFMGFIKVYSMSIVCQSLD